MKEDYFKLIEDYFAGKIQNNDIAQLNEILGIDKEARSYFITHASINEHLDESSNVLDLPKFRTTDFNIKAEKNRTKLPLLVASLVIAFIVFQFHERKVQNGLSVTTFKDQTENLEGNETIKLIDHINVSIKGISTPVEDFVWTFGKYELLSGKLHLRLNHCVDFLLEGPSSFEIEDIKNISITRGKIRTIVLNENGKGFTIKSPTTSYADLGTEYMLQITPNRKDKFDIRNGKVEVIPNKTFSKRKFVDVFNKNRQVLPDTQIDQSLNALSPGDIGAQRNNEIFRNFCQDQDVIGLYNFDFVEQSSITNKYLSNIPDNWQKLDKNPKHSLTAKQYFTNHAKSKKVSHGIQKDCYRTKGRWPNSFCLSLPYFSSRILLQFPESYSEFTINFWIQKLHLSHARQALFRPLDWSKPGQLSLEFSRSGTVSLHHWGESKLLFNKMHNQALDSNWQLISYTFEQKKNGSQSKIYFNGNLELETRLNWTKKTSMRDCLIGGFISKKGEPFGTLNCNIDEILILKKSWSEEQIKNYFVNGFPFHQIDNKKMAKNGNFSIQTINL